jgi:hypothetical protein
MRRLFGLFAMAAVALGLLLLFVAPGIDETSGAIPSVVTRPWAYGGWVIGLGTGLLLAWLLRLDWATMPARLCAWLGLQRRRLVWALVGTFFAGILLLY